MAWFLVLAFLVVPIAEIWVIIQVGQAFGAWQTLVLLIAESLLGGWIVRREGRRAWRALRQSVDSGRLPNRELTDGALVLVGGTLLLTPGFLTDVVGFFFVLPFTRPFARRVVTRWLARRATVTLLEQHSGGSPGANRRPGRGRFGPAQVVEGEIVDGEVVDGGGPPQTRHRPAPPEGGRGGDG